MLKSILVALNDSRSGRVAQDLAIETALAHDAAVTGLAILNQPEPTSFSQMLAWQVEQVTHAHAAEQAAALKRIEAEAAEFAGRCSARGVACTPLAGVGAAYPYIATESRLHDLIIIGRQHVAGSETREDAAEITRLMLSHSVRPIILAPPAMPEDGNAVVVAYDGSAPASRAVQLFALMDLDAGREVHVVSINDKGSVAEAMALNAAAYLRRHGLTVFEHGIASREAPADVIANTCKVVGAQMVVAGALGHKGWHEALVGSSTLALIRFAHVPLFISS